MKNLAATAFPDEIARASALIRDARADVRGGQALLVAVSGIDGAGKGYVSKQMVADFCRLGANAAGINIDGWLNLPHVRFGKKRPEEHFYRSAIRFDEMFERLVLPLKANRTYRVEFDFAEETATSFRRQTYDFRDVDVAVVEGIFLLKIEHRKHFDLSFWVDCTFETAMERALSRRQEALSDEETRRAYETIYFPAQRIHFARDNPRKAAGSIVRNDWRLAG